MFGYPEPAPCDSKHDRPSLCANGFRLIANLQHPPLTHLYRNMRYYAVRGGFGVGFILYVVVPPLLARSGLFVLLGLSLLVLQGLVQRAPFVAWDMLGRRRDKVRLGELEALGEKDEVEPRIQVRGRAVELLEIAGLPDASFEPRIFRVAQRYLGLSLESQLVVLILCGVGVVFGLFARARFPCFLMPLLIWVVLLYGLLRSPSYYRVIPGRVDILRFPTLRQHPDHVEQIDLRGAKVRIDLTSTKEYIHIQGRERTYQFRRDDTCHPLGFAVAIAHAARTTAETPNIPMDALLG
jgi:hypothetical protein